MFISKLKALPPPPPSERGLADPRLADLGYRYLTSPPLGVPEAPIGTFK